jgi:hypothetical protein
MYKICCVCSRTIDEADDYDRIGTDFYCSNCSNCSNNNLVPCPICKTCIDPNVDTEFQAPNGTLFCSKECLEIISSTCMDCGCIFTTTNIAHICPACLIKGYGG